MKHNALVLDSLPLIPKQYLDESDNSYWVRVFIENRLGLSTAFDLMGDDFTKCVGNSRMDLSAVPLLISSHVIDVGNDKIALEHFDLKKIRACPKCIGDAPYHRIFWQLRAVRSCHVHDVMLRDRCNKCGRNYDLTVLMQGVCRCDAVIAHNYAEPAPSGFSDVTHYVYMKAFENLAPRASDQNIFASLPRSLSLNEFLTLIKHLAIVKSRGLESIKSRKDLEEDPTFWNDLVADSITWLEDWPRAFDKCINESIRIKHGPGRLSEIDEKRFQFIRSGQYPEFKFIHQRLQKALDESWRRHWKNDCNLSVSPPQSGVVHRISDVSDMLSINGREVYRLCEHGHLKMVSGPEVDGGSVRAVSQTSVEDLLKNIYNMMAPKTTIEVVRFSSVASVFRAVAVGLPELVSLILSGRMTPIGFDRRRSGLRALLFNFTEVVKELMVQTASKNNLEIPDTAQVLGLKKGTLKGLIDGGYVVAFTDRWPIKVPMESVHEFNKKYFLAARLALACDVSCQNIVKMFENADHQPLLADRGMEKIYPRSILETSEVMAGIESLRLK